MYLVHHLRGTRFFFERDLDVLGFHGIPVKRCSRFIRILFDILRQIYKVRFKMFFLPLRDDPRDEAKGFVIRTDPRVSRKIGRVFWQFCPKDPADSLYKCEDNSARYFLQWVRASRHEFRHRRRSSEEGGIDEWVRKSGWEAPEHLATLVPVWNL